MKEIKNKRFKISINTSELISNLLVNSTSLALAISTGKKEEILGSIVPFINVFSSVDIEDSQEKILLEYVRKSLGAATLKILSLLNKSKVPSRKFKAIPKKFIKSEKTIFVDDNILTKPGKSLIAQKYIDLLCDSLESVSTIDEADIKMIRNSWDNIFSKCANEEWEKNIEIYSTISNEYYLSPMHKYIESIAKEEQYKNQLEKMMELEVFDGACILDDIFIDLNCVVTNTRSCLKTEEIKSSMNFLNNWSESNEKGMLLLEGDPGSGKSTLLKELARNLIRKNVHVIFFNLFKLNFSSKKDCIDVIEKELNSLGWYNELECNRLSNVIYIFDGLDEIKCDVWSNAIELVQQLIHSNYYRTQKIIISGRKRIVEHCHEKIGNIPTVTILPMRVYSDNSKKYLDIRNHMWMKLKSVFSLEIEFTSMLKKENFNELSETPLLLFLLAWTFKNEPSSIDKIDNSVQLYRQILHCVYNRNYNINHGENFENKIEYESYLKILFAIGACAWQNNSREIPVNMIEKYCNAMQLSNEYKKWFEDKECIGSSKLFLIFFAHEKHSNDDSYFEFIHKSFYEYLSIEEIMHLIFKCDELKDKQIIMLFCFLFSKNYINTDFIYYYIEDMYTNDLNDFLKFKRHVFHIESLIGYEKIDETLYAKGINNQIFEYKNLHEFISGYKYIRENIWRLIQYIFVIYSKKPNASIQTDLSFCGVSLYNMNIKIKNLQYSIFSKCTLQDLTFTCIEFSYGEWADCEVYNCIFCQGLFNYMTLNHVKIYYSHLEAVSFAESKIAACLFDGIRLNASYIVDAKVYESQFEDCDFSFANFDDSIFKETTFINCIFDYADFTNASFTGCKFEDCSFSGTNLKNVNVKDLINSHKDLVLDLLDANHMDAIFEGLSDDIINRFKQNFLQ